MKSILAGKKKAPKAKKAAAAPKKAGPPVVSIVKNQGVDVPDGWRFIVIPSDADEIVKERLEGRPGWSKCEFKGDAYAVMCQKKGD